MIDELETFLLSILQTIYDTLGWFGVSALLVFENATGIMPSEIILGLAGWMLIEKHQISPAMIFLGGFYAALGSTLGASITYWVARIGGRPLVDMFVRWVKINPDRVQRTEKQFERWGAGLVLVGRIIPGIRTIINIPAGLARMSFVTFFAATFIGSYLWCTLLIGAGYVLGHEWAYISVYLKQSLPYLLGGGALALALYFLVTHLFTFSKKYPALPNDD
ncbi:MAG: DedA family protein [Anaerolineaceae bacterium]|nr:DedA family protein [Anaerolineaceae bacterium]